MTEEKLIELQENLDQIQGPRPDWEMVRCTHNTVQRIEAMLWEILNLLVASPEEGAEQLKGGSQ